MHFILSFFLRGERREEGREANIDAREEHQSVVFWARPDWGPNPQT